MATKPQVRWRQLIVALLAISVAVTLLHWLSPLLPGTAGAVFRRNVAHDVEATALIYSESGDIHDYLDDHAGRYRSAP